MRVAIEVMAADSPKEMILKLREKGLKKKLLIHRRYKSRKACHTFVAGSLPLVCTKLKRDIGEFLDPEMTW